MAFLEAKSIYKHFKEVKAVDGVSLSINQGEYTAILGPNGAGKTTLIEMIEGIQYPNKGEISINGMNWKHHKTELNKILGISLQETRFIEKLTVLETLELFASFHHSSKERVNEILDLIKLQDKRKSYMKNLSGGQKQRLTLGIALLNYPEILLLDEPTTGLDPTSRREIWNILSTLKKEGKTTLILTTHYMEEAEFLCERIVIMDKGKILVDEQLKSLLTNFTSEEIVDFSLENNLQPYEFSNLPDKIKIKYNAEKLNYQMVVEKASSELPHFFEILKTHDLQLKTIECRKKTLDDLFISLTGRHLMTDDDK